MLVSIIILNWNGLEVLGPCLKAITGHTLIEDYEVIVLDNGLHQAGIEDVVKPYPRVRLIKESVNHGFSRGNNIAVRAALGELLVILNNDTLPRRDRLRPLIETLRGYPGAGIVGSRLVDANDATLFAGSYFLPAINAYTDAYRNYPPGLARDSEPRECEAYIACGILMSRALYDEVGGFDEHYFQGYEDIDLSLRIKDRGFKVVCCPHSTVEHLEHVSMNKLDRRTRRRAKESNRDYFENRWRRRIHEFRLPELPDSLSDFAYYTFPRDQLFEMVPQRGGRVLEVGCGAGVMGERLKRSGKARHVTGIEIGRDAARLAESRLDAVRTGDIETLDLGEYRDGFDTLIVADVLEHLRDPWKALFKLRTCLVDDGVVVASIPNITHYRIIKKMLANIWRYEPSGILDHTHLRFFSRGSIEDLFLNAGFEILRIERGESRRKWWLRLFGTFNERLHDFNTVQYYVLAKKLLARGSAPG